MQKPFLNIPWLKPVVVFALCEHGGHPYLLVPIFLSIRAVLWCPDGVVDWSVFRQE